MHQKLLCISAMQNMLANQICMFYTCKSCTIVGEQVSSQMYLFSPEGSLNTVNDSSIVHKTTVYNCRP